MSDEVKNENLDEELELTASGPQSGEEDEQSGQWYVVHTYSGYENKVKANLEKTVENRGLQDLIMEVSVPMEESVEIKNGKRKTVQRKVFPGYVIVRMIMTDESWYVVRNTRGVTGFVGPGSKPVPLTKEEIENMGVHRKGVKMDIEVGQSVRVTDGPLENFVGVVLSVDPQAQKMRVNVSMFGRDTPVELDYLQVQKVQ
ncbi:MAG: transcription termination/antitermination protein NusG [Christensenellales bacterium]|jgi:transcriptional antiterminator NusG